MLAWITLLELSFAKLVSLWLAVNALRLGVDQKFVGGKGKEKKER